MLYNSAQKSVRKIRVKMTTVVIEVVTRVGLGVSIRVVTRAVAEMMMRKSQLCS